MSISDAQFQRWLERTGEARCALFELTFLGEGGSPLGGVEYQAYVSNMPYVTRSTDTPAHQEFAECVIEVPPFTRRMGEQLEGRSTQSFGDLILSNEYTLTDDGQVLSEGVRDDWLSMNWDGRRIRMWIGDPGWAFADFRLVLDGRINDVFDPGGYKLGFKISDKASLLDRPIMTTLLGGDGPEDGELMPLCLGGAAARIQNITPKLIEVTDRLYRFTQSGGGEVPYTDTSLHEENPYDVREDGASLLGDDVPLDSSDAGTDLLTIAGHGFVAGTRIQFLFDGANDPPPPLVTSYVGNRTNYWVSSSGLTSNDFKAAPTYADAIAGTNSINLTGAQTGNVEVRPFGWTAHGDGTFNIASNPLGLITADVLGLCGVGSPTFLPSTAGEIIEQLLTSSLTNTPLTSADIDAASLAAFNTLCDMPMAVYLTEQTTFAQLFDKLVLSVGGWWGFSRDGLLQFGRLDLPVPGSPPAPVYSFSNDDIARRTMRMQRRILPRAEVKIRAIANWTPQTVIAGSVTLALREFYAMQYVTVTGTATVTTWDTDPTNHINAARPQAYDSLASFGGATNPQDEADRLATLFQYPTAVRHFQTHQAAYLLEMGNLIYVESSRYTGYGIVVELTERLKGRSEVGFFAQLPDDYSRGESIPPAGITVPPAEETDAAGTFGVSSEFNLTAGNLVVVCTKCPSVATTCDDLAGNTYIPLTPQSGAGGNMRIFYCLSASGHANNVVTLNSTVGGNSLQVMQFSGYTTLDLDTGGTNATATNVNTVSISTTAAGLVIINNGTGSGLDDTFTNSFSVVPPVGATVLLTVASRVTGGALVGQTSNMSGGGNTSRTHNIAAFK